MSFGEALRDSTKRQLVTDVGRVYLPSNISGAARWNAGPVAVGQVSLVRPQRER
jgi:hypothetical protein